MANMLSKTLVTTANRAVTAQDGWANGLICGSHDSFLREPFWPYKVRIEYRDCVPELGTFYPRKEITDWLRDHHRHGEIGPWESVLANDARFLGRARGPVTQDVINEAVEDRYYLIVSFANEDDAVLFKMRWSGVK